MRSQPTKTKTLRDFLLKEIAEQRITQGAKLPSETELMSQFGISRSSVRQVLSELSVEGWVERQQGRGTFCLNPARARRQNERTMLVGVWFNWPSGPLFGPISQGIRAELACYGYHAVFEDGGLQVGAEAVAVKSLLRKALDGFILAPSCNSDDDHAPLLHLIEQKTPIVLVDCPLREYQTDLVATANEVGGGEVVEHLLELGHRRIGFVGAEDVPSIRDRLRGYRSTMRRHGLTIDEAWIQASPKVDDDAGRQAAHLLLDLPADHRPTAIFGAFDVLAETVAMVARERGLNLPKDLSIVGFDDIVPSSDHSAWLTTYAQPKQRIGQHAARLLIERIQNPASSTVTLLLEGRLIKRASTAAPPE